MPDRHEFLTALGDKPPAAATLLPLLLGVLAYLAVTMPRLGVFPPVGEDEPWIAAAPYKLATQGVLGSDLFAGYYGMERHHYAHMPIYPLAQAAVFKAFGAGVVQMRALPVACGLLLLVVVFIVGRQAGGDRVGALSVALMLTLRMTAGGAGTGILLLDRARINRYDIAVSRPAAARRSPASSETAPTGLCRCTWCRRRSRLAIPNPEGTSIDGAPLA